MESGSSVIYQKIKSTFWKPQIQAIERFEEVTNHASGVVDIKDVCPMRACMCCGSGKSRLTNVITLRFDRSCIFFPSLGWSPSFLFVKFFFLLL